MLSERARGGSLSETRKVTKSAMEKKRRARINTSLVELKTILGGMISHKTERFDKMEKADILEMTVRYVKQLQRKSEQLSGEPKTKDEDYKNGVNSCISEVIKYIASSSSCNDEIKAKLLDHLANRLTGTEDTYVRQDCKSPVSSGRETESSSPETVQYESSTEQITVQTPVPVNINVASVSPTVQTLSPGSNTNQLTIAGQCTATSMQTSPVIHALQQSSPLLSNIPVTIIVPANLYPSVSGTTCVIPLNIPTTATTQVPTISEPSSNAMNNTSPPTQQVCDHSRIAYSAHLQPQRMNTVICNRSTEQHSDALRGGHEQAINNPCNNENQTLLKDTVSYQPRNCYKMKHSQGIHNFHQEQPWRPW